MWFNNPISIKHSLHTWDGVLRDNGCSVYGACDNNVLMRVFTKQFTYFCLPAIIFMLDSILLSLLTRFLIGVHMLIVVYHTGNVM